MFKLFHILQYVVGFFSLFLLGCSDPILKPSVVVVRSPEDIYPLDGKWVRPVIYNNQINFSDLPVAVKKEKFIQMLLPSILVTRHNLEVDRQKILDITHSLEKKSVLHAADSMFLLEKLQLFKAKTPQDLLERMVTHPNSIVIAQAAVESGWGSSRFFKEANNIFGIWSYNPKERRIRASESRGEKSIYLRSYSDLSGSVKDYFITLGRARAYATYRKKRLDINNPLKLIHYLKGYSELGLSYVSMLDRLILDNNLTRYDTLKLDPAYYQNGSRIIL